MKSYQNHKRIYEDKVLTRQQRISLDPFNIKSRDQDLHNPVHHPHKPHGLDLNKEESPTNTQSHHICNPNAKIKQIKDKPRKVSHRKVVDITSNQQKTVKHDIRDTEIIRSKQIEYPNIQNRHYHGSQFLQNK